MPAPRNKKHIVVPTLPTTEPYTPHPRIVRERQFNRPSDRVAHARSLQSALNRASAQARRSRETVGISVHGSEPGLYIQFESVGNAELKLDSLEDRRRGIELVAVQSRPSEQGRPPVQLATVFIPDGAVGHFLRRFEQYATETTRKGEPRHKDLVDRIARLRRATLRALWTDDQIVYPGDAETVWWEVWLRRHDGHELDRILEFAQVAGLRVGQHRLAFDDRVVVLLEGTSQELAASLDVLNDIAEVRRAKVAASLLVDAPADTQAEIVNSLRERSTWPSIEAPAVCVLDTGVTRGHPLLEELISPADASAVDPAWGPHDDGGGPGMMGHGTEMAGLAAYGDLSPLLASGTPVRLRHRLESVKILPPTGANEPENYGSITAQAVARAEINAPQRSRIFSLAVTAADQRDRGQPTSWSAALDAMAAGRGFDPSIQGLRFLDEAEEGAHRLFVVSAGNVAPPNLEAAHLNRSDLEPVHDPAHAWNALTVGACTDRALISDPTMADWRPVSAPGDLSPWSTTSVLFQEGWPIKPDLVYEGGNVAINGSEIDYPVADLSLLTTNFRPADRLMAISYATSAATAQVARIAAIVHAEYPTLWPETIRALVVQSGRWTRTMEAHLRGAGGKRDRARLVRRYGFGVPELTRALRSANDSLTLVTQSTLHPFSNGKMREMHFHSLPWPKTALEELGSTAVRLRVTLSYFVEPNPGRRGWKHRHRYASHGLRFDVKGPTETVDEFRKRLNEQALDDEEDRPSSSRAPSGWFLGEQARNRGSLHSDIWVGTAADLAERGVVGVYPVSGWWKDQPRRDRSEIGARYGLCLSIETDAEDVDIWTPVAVSIALPTEAATITW